MDSHVWITIILGLVAIVAIRSGRGIRGKVGLGGCEVEVTEPRPPQKDVPAN